MKDIVTFYDKTIGKTNEDTKNTESTLKSATEKEESVQIERAIKMNKESTKYILQQKKFKKFNTLKHKLQTSHRESNLKEYEKERTIRTYAKALVQGPGRRSPSQEKKNKTEKDQSPNVTSRNTSLLNYLSSVLTCQRALRSYVLTCQRALRAHVLPCQCALRAYVPTCVACSRAQVQTCLACLCGYVPTCLACLRTHVPICLRAQVLCVLLCSNANVLMCLRLKVPRVPCLTFQSSLPD